MSKIAVVLVTSYIGISPRSANHAYELAETGLYDIVYFIGQKGTLLLYTYRYKDVG